MPLERYLTDRRLRDMVEDTLDECRVRRRGILRYDYVRQLKDRVIRGDYMETKKLFALVILEWWFRAFVDGER